VLSHADVGLAFIAIVLGPLALVVKTPVFDLAREGASL